MPAPSTPQNFYVQTGNAVNFLSWNNTAGATGYTIQRSTDGINYSNYATVTVNQYLDTAVTIGTAYYYQVAASNLSGTGPYTAPQSVVPATSGEMSLGAIRLAAQQRADRVESNFVTLQEWNFYINQALFELYDLLITAYANYYMAPTAAFTTDGQTFLFPLPDGVTTFQNQNGQNFVPAPFYKLEGVDLCITNANNAWVTVDKFNFIDRNKYIYPNSSSTIYGVFNMQYRLIGSQIEFVPTPSAGQIIRLWYIPRMQQLLLDTDVTTQGVSGWLQYVIIRAAKYALDKEESDTTKLDAELLFLKGRIEESAVNRDVGQADTISDVRGSRGWGGMGGGWNSPIGGWILAGAASLPVLMHVLLGVSKWLI